MNTAAKLSTGGKLSTAPFSASKKSGMKRENPPCTPYKRKARGKENNPSALSTVYSRARIIRARVRRRVRAHPRTRGDPPMRQDRPSAGRPRHAAETHRPGEAPRHAQGAGMPSDVLADPQKRLKQGEINMRNHGKNEDTEKIIYKSAERLYFRHRNALLRLFKIGFSCQ